VDIEEYLRTNRDGWDESAILHVDSYGADRLADDPTAIASAVRKDAELMAPHLPEGSVRGLSLVHLQCHIGTDTLSWGRLGAEVTGVDFSPEAIHQADRLAQRAGIPARFVLSTVDAAPQALPGERFDIVYTSVGALMWLPDLEDWAKTVAALLKPGGLFFVRDQHPMESTLDESRSDGEFMVTFPYFSTGSPVRDEDASDYSDESAVLTNTVSYWWPHPLSEIIGSLLRAGLAIVAFDEHREMDWRALPTMVREGDWFVLPDHAERLPLMFSLAARAPAA
jgi:2-polyprenyl-3-methyl-5-hydroxy-6-metoxy-1,4-benzoquinol methylase